jgi:hypothetical protein
MGEATKALSCDTKRILTLLKAETEELARLAAAADARIAKSRHDTSLEPHQPSACLSRSVASKR